VKVATIEADKGDIERVEYSLPQTVKGERPGMIFNVCCGIQGQVTRPH
jgi:hypothetical protein